MVIGGGKTQNYAALLLMLAGMAAGGVAVYYTQIGGRWLLPAALSVLLMLASCLVVAAKREA